MSCDSKSDFRHNSLYNRNGCQIHVFQRSLIYQLKNFFKNFFKNFQLVSTGLYFSVSVTHWDKGSGTWGPCHPNNTICGYGIMEHQPTVCLNHKEEKVAAGLCTNRTKEKKECFLVCKGKCRISLDWSLTSLNELHKMT